MFKNVNTDGRNKFILGRNVQVAHLSSRCRLDIYFFQFFNFKFKKRFDGGLSKDSSLVFLPQLTTRAAYQ